MQKRSLAVSYARIRRSRSELLRIAMRGMPDKAKPGETLHKILAEMPAHDRPLFLQHLEEKYREQGDFEMLREIREYKRRQMDAQPSTKPPEAG